MKIFRLVALPLCWLMIASACHKTQIGNPTFKCPESGAELPQIEGIDQETGHLDVKDGKLFYWLIRAENDSDDTPLVFWLNGGPGGSSLIGLFWENGPYRLNDDLSVYENPESWHQHANVVYLDQPAGTGFSLDTATGGTVKTESDVADDLVMAILAFYEKQPNLRGRKLYLFGESFAGTYIPWGATRILEHNAQNLTNTINLAGVGIGDGTVDRLASWTSVPQFALNNALISNEDFNQMQSSMVPSCQRQLTSFRESKTLKSPEICLSINSFVTDRATNINIYDIRRFGSYDFQRLTCYLNQANIRNFVGAEKPSWVEDNRAVFQALSGGGILPTTDKVASLLQNNIKVLIYSGNKDLLIPHLGTEAWLDELAQGKHGDIDGGQAFAEAKFSDWRVNGKVAGKTKSGGKLTYVLINGAGHMAPLDQGLAARLMFSQFLSGESIASVSNED